MDNYKKMPSINDNIIEFKDVNFFRGTRAIFANTSFDIKKGKITAIMGPSGTGKTTILRLITGILRPDSGSIMVDGQDVAKMNAKEIDSMRRKMSLLFQSGALFTSMTVFDNVAFPLREHTNLPESMIRDLVLMKLQAVGLRGASNLFPRELSGGMARRVALSRAIALDPEIILYDEPFAGQDPIAMGVLVKLIKLLNDALGLTSVIVSHDVAETLSIADYVHIVANGNIVASGTASELLENNTPEVQQFLDGLPDGPVGFHYPANSYKEDLFMENN